MTLFPVLVFLYGGVGSSAGEWTPDEQVRMENPSSVSVSPDGAWAVFSVGSVGGEPGNLTATGSLVLREVSADAADATPLPTAFCADGSCASPSFGSDGTLLFIKSGELYASTNSGGAAWSVPRVVQSLPAGDIISYSVAPDGKSVATTYAEMGTYSATEGRVITTDVIVNVITGTPQPTRNVLCVGTLGGGAAPTRCYPQLSGSVGMEGWRISCWPYDSTVSWSADGHTLALTLTANRLANDWESVRVALLDTRGPATPTVRFVGDQIAFQPLFAPDGKTLAFTQSVSATNYTWSQTWKICVVDVSAPSGAAARCDESGTFDEMPTLVGWAPRGDALLYVEQVSLLSLLSLPLQFTRILLTI